MVTTITAIAFAAGFLLGRRDLSRRSIVTRAEECLGRAGVLATATTTLENSTTQAARELLTRYSSAAVVEWYGVREELTVAERQEIEERYDAFVGLVDRWSRTHSLDGPLQ